ncbi:hypothetical protein [Mycobacterium sp. URHB0021]
MITQVRCDQCRQQCTGYIISEFGRIACASCTMKDRTPALSRLTWDELENLALDRLVASVDDENGCPDRSARQQLAVQLQLEGALRGLSWADASRAVVAISADACQGWHLHKLLARAASDSWDDPIAVSRAFTIVVEVLER